MKLRRYVTVMAARKLNGGG